MSLIDIGVNLASSQFKNAIPDVLQRAREAGVNRMVLTGTSLEVSSQLQQLQHKFSDTFPGMLYTTVGIHPHHASDFSPDALEDLKGLVNFPGVVAIGETGLDFNRNLSTPVEQEKAFSAQLELAATTGLPVFLHERDAHKRQFEILKDYRDSLTGAVIHCFTGDRQAMFNYLDLDLHIGITGWICDERRGLELQHLVHNIPLERLMLETDAPYLLPRTIDPPPANRRNEPCYLPWVLRMVAQCRGEPEELIATATTGTAIRFFHLPEHKDTA